MLVICIDNDNPKQKGLTNNKKYNLINYDNEDSIKYNGYEIENDLGDIIFYRKNRFISLREYNILKILK